MSNVIGKCPNCDGKISFEDVHKWIQQEMKKQQKKMENKK